MSIESKKKKEKRTISFGLFEGGVKCIEIIPQFRNKNSKYENRLLLKITFFPMLLYSLLGKISMAFKS